MGTTSYSTVTCTYSSAALAACTTRKRRGITVDDDEDQQFIEASPVERVIATQAADMDAVREKRQFFESMNDLAEINASYDYDQSLQRTLPSISWKTDAFCSTSRQSPRRPRYPPLWSARCLLVHQQAELLCLPAKQQLYNFTYY